ncbi:hypothetical protein NEFER03_2124 [Nematocida sp. LUAm3]|nr:hypothetical protein NEFER03_2124 [Nematocida sp. LUAm3]KAI5175624.1 hypothetical protein NEFER02_1511 [Nematocida sp. LUAm2]KAI5178530.1 hypothetical protein NEFER01_1666 [Nematocida sp. LUAm1]
MLIEEKILNQLALDVVSGKGYNLLGSIERLSEEPKMVESQVYSGRLLAMKLYIYTAYDGNLTETKRILEHIDLKKLSKNIKDCFMERSMISNALKCCGRIKETELFLLGDEYLEKYEISILSGEYQLARKYGVRLIKQTPAYSMVAVLLQDPPSLSNLQYLFNLCAPSASLLRILYKKGISFLHIKNKIPLLRKDFHFFLLLRDLFSSGEDVSEFFANTSSFSYLHEFLSSLDDWKIYKEILRRNIPFRKDIALHREENITEKGASKDDAKQEISDTEKHNSENNSVNTETSSTNGGSLNYLRYLMEANASVESVRDFISSPFICSTETLLVALDSIKKLSKEEKESLYLSVPYGIQKRMDMLVFRRKFELTEEYLRNSLKKEEDFLFLVGALLSERKEEAILLSLILSYSFCNLFSSFSIRLLLCVIFRYFLCYEQVANMYLQLDPQNSQLEEITYLWNDLSILLSKKNPLLSAQYMRVYNELLAQATISIIDFIGQEKYSQTLSLVSFREALINSSIYKQVSTNSFVRPGTSSINIEKGSPGIERIVIPSARYIFKKANGNISSDSSILLSLETLPSSFSSSDVSLMFWRVYNEYPWLSNWIKEEKASELHEILLSSQISAAATLLSTS